VVLKQLFYKSISIGMLFLAISGYAQDQRVQQVLQGFHPDSLQAEVRKLSGEIPVSISSGTVFIQSRLYNSPGNNYAFEYLKQNLERYGLQTTSHSFSTLGRNLFGIKPGTIFPERICMIGAHYDNVPTGQIAPGADDNASGCAAVLEAARLLSGMEFPNTLVFAFWDEEELGLIGSNAYVADGIYGDSLLGYINLDMIGWDGNGDKLAELHTRPVARSLELATQFITCNQLYETGLNLQVVNPGSINTDHYSFWQGGYTAVGLIEEYEGDENPHYHTVTDQYLYLDTAYMASNARLAIAVLATLGLDKSPVEGPVYSAANAQLFPNPADKVLIVRFPEAILSPFEISLIDNSGRTILIKQASHTDQVILQIEDVSAGNYQIVIYSADYRYTFRVIVQ
jgi:hypothetical protein